MKKTLLILLTCFIFLSQVSSILASVGVGVGTGKIEVDEKLKPGVNYTLPPLTVYNTGDETAVYYVSIDYAKKENLLQSDLDWYSFSPKEFTLKPKESQIVEIELKMPLKGAKPGDYFAFLTAQPKSSVQEGKTSVGIVAACKLYFTVEPANLLQALYYRISYLYETYKPWSIIIPSLLLLFILWKLFRKKFKINITKAK